MGKLVYRGLTPLDGVADEEGNFDCGVPDQRVHRFAATRATSWHLPVRAMEVRSSSRTGCGGPGPARPATDSTWQCRFGTFARWPVTTRTHRRRCNRRGGNPRMGATAPRRPGMHSPTGRVIEDVRLRADRCHQGWVTANDSHRLGRASRCVFSASGPLPCRGARLGHFGCGLGHSPGEPLATS